VAASRVLVVQTAFLGDVAFTSALVESLAASFSEVDVCVAPRGRDVAEAMPRAARVHVFDKRGTDGGLRGLRRAAESLRERRFDVAVLAHRSIRSAVLARLAGIPRRVGFLLAPGAPLYTQWVSARARTYTQREAALAAALGAEPRPMRLVPHARWIEAAEERLGGAAGPFAALCIGSEWETKIWPPEHFAALADRLAERGLTPILLGGPREKPLAAAVQARAGAQCIDTTGNPVGEALALIARCRVCVGGDSGLVHAARALSVPTVAMFGPTAPAAHQLGPRQRAVSLSLGCSPCSVHGQRRCPLGHHRCLRELSAERVLAECEAVLA